MPLFGAPTDLEDMSGELAKLGPALGSAIDRFRRQISARAARATAEQSRKAERRAARRAVRLPLSRAGRPVARHLPIPRRVTRIRRPATLRRPHTPDAKAGAGPSSIGAAAQRITGAVRNRLLALRSGLRRLGGRLTGGSRAVGRITRRR